MLSKKLQVALSCTFLFFTACSKSEKSVDDVFPKFSKNTCPEAPENQYLVEWEDGRVTLEKEKTREEIIRSIVEPNMDLIKRVEPNFKIKILPFNNEANNIVSASTFNWHHYAVESYYAWNRGIYGSGVKVAVVDSGVDIEHELLEDSIAINTDEIPDNGIDDDRNGYVDDVKGYDFFLDRPYVTDPAGHGTHVTGIISAEHLENIGSASDLVSSKNIFGLAPQVRIIPVRFLGPQGEGDTNGAIKAIDYAVAQGAKVINASWGGSECSQILINKLVSLESQDVLFVSAAGNNDLNVDQQPVYPGYVESSTLINVASTDENGPLSSFSNYGLSSVDIAAPGRDIYSTYPGNQITKLSGTSMAAPLVSALAALIKSADPLLPMSEVKRIIEGTGIDRNLEVETRAEIHVPAALSAL